MYLHQNVNFRLDLNNWQKHNIGFCQYRHLYSDCVHVPMTIYIVFVPVYIVIGFFMELPIAVRIGNSAGADFSVHIFLDTIHGVCVKMGLGEPEFALPSLK